VAYSTLSQLGYMTVALGASAYSAAVFHLMTHAFFKALLFLAAGSVIIAMHHEQDMRKMGGLKKYMPITYWTSLIGTLALIGFPGFSGFFSKDAIIEAVHHSDIFGSSYAYYMVLGGVFVTAFYSFRLLFLVFHGKERMDDHTREHLHETPWVVTVPLIVLAIPSVIIGGLTIAPMLFGDYFKDVIFVNASHDVLATIGESFHGAFAFVQHGFHGAAIYLAAGGAGLAWYLYMKNPPMAENLKNRFSFLHKMLDKKYWIDEVYFTVFAKGSRLLGAGFWKGGDVALIDGLIVNGSGKAVVWLAGVTRQLQTGMLYHYAFAMVLGLIAMLYWFV